MADWGEEGGLTRIRNTNAHQQRSATMPWSTLISGLMLMQSYATTLKVPGTQARANDAWARLARCMLGEIAFECKVCLPVCFHDTSVCACEFCNTCYAIRAKKHALRRKHIKRKRITLRKALLTKPCSPMDSCRRSITQQFLATLRAEAGQMHALPPSKNGYRIIWISASLSLSVCLTMTKVSVSMNPDAPLRSAPDWLLRFARACTRERNADLWPSKQGPVWATPRFAILPQRCGKDFLALFVVVATIARERLSLVLLCL